MAQASSPADLRRFAHFIGAGLINTCFGYAAFAAFRWMSGNDVIALVCGTIAGVIFNYHTIGAVFATRGLSRLPHFLGVYGGLLLVNIGLLHALTAQAVNTYLAQGLIVLLLTPVSFLAMRRFVFAAAPEHAS